MKGEKQREEWKKKKGREEWRYADVKEGQRKNKEVLRSPKNFRESQGR